MAIRIIKDGFRKGYYGVYETRGRSMELLGNFAKKSDATAFANRRRQGYYKNAGWTNIAGL